MMKKVCILTGTRADYGLFSPLIERISSHEKLELQMIVTGTHLSPEFGMTYKLIEEEGYSIDEKVEILLSSDTEIGISKSMGLAMIGISEALDRLKPDVLVLLGDRYETFIAASAATIARIPIAHLHGGETTEGAYDEAFRHSITKMSYLHFTSTEEYRNRVIQLGEDPKRVFNVGALGVENIKKLDLLTKEELEDSLNIKINGKFLLVTFHPVTLEGKSAEEQTSQLLKALSEIDNCTILFTKANADSHGRSINKLIEEFVAQYPNKSYAFDNLGKIRYLSAMNICNAVIGNSSSGILETPSFNIPTINIGDRQKGRIQADSIINCLPEYQQILKAFNKAFSDEFGEKIKKTINPYGKENVSLNIIKQIEYYLSVTNDLKKKFYDLEI